MTPQDVPRSWVLHAVNADAIVIDTPGAMIIVDARSVSMYYGLAPAVATRPIEAIRFLVELSAAIDLSGGIRAAQIAFGIETVAVVLTANQPA